ncbi:MAG TPA: arginine deiminase-related protein [Blastocatellia bacterium]|nr:arginine deiminase-related protein [Blastocatellia bacterium]
MNYRLAITRKPGRSFAQGVTTANLGAPDFDLAFAQHEQYVAVLKTCGVEVIDLDADENFPDGCFVEDTALITPEFAVITNPGAASRRGETAALIPVLEQYRPLKFLDPTATLDGGDVMLIEKTFYVGLSERTTTAAASNLGEIVAPFGYNVVPITVAGILHLKTGVCYIGANTIVATPQFARCPEFDCYQKIATLPAENYAANCLRINDHLVVAAGFPDTRYKLSQLGLPVLEVNISEARKMDGGLTCSSLLLQ